MANLTENNVPNFDAMAYEELMVFWYTHQSGRNYKDIFPNGGKGTKRAAADLANYASNKATAFNLRVDGFIDSAQMYESICDRIYNTLPSFARW